MAKFVIACPSCGSYAEGKTGLFAKKKIQCACGHVIDVRKEKHTIKRCENCGNNVLFSQSKGNKALCPVCKTPVNTIDSIKRMVKVQCPQCSCTISVDKTSKYYECPMCKCQIDVQREIARGEQVENDNISVIQYNGPNDVLVWKHPITDFNRGSQLIVHESQEALVFRDGMVSDPLKSDRYEVETQQFPFIDRIQNLPSESDNTVFHSEVYFINLATQMGIKWGTDSRVRFVDPITGVPLDIGACGEMNMKVSDSKKLILKIVGTTETLTRERSAGMSVTALTDVFQAPVSTSVKTHLAQTIRDAKINILEIDQHLDELSIALKTHINERLDEYGLTLSEFYVTRISLPTDDPNFNRMRQQYADLYLNVRDEQIKCAETEAAANRKITEAKTEARIKIVGAQGDAEAYRLQAETMKKRFGGAVDPIKSSTNTWNCSCGNNGIIGNYCNICGAKKV